jgi:hypothetical protein
LFAATACSDHTDPRPEQDEVEAIPFPSTHVLTESDLESLLPEDGHGKLSFESVPSSLESIAPGEVIVAGLSSSTPHGLMRVVTKVDSSGSGLVLDTLQAPLQIAFKKLHVKARRSTRPIGTPANGPGTSAADGGISAPGLGMQALGGSESTSIPIDMVLFDGDGDSSTINDQVVVHGELGGGFDYGFGFDVDWGSITDLPKAVKNCIASLVNVVVGQPPDCSLAALLPEAKASFDVDPRVTADAKVTGAAVLDYKKDFDLLSINEPPLVLGPLVFFPVIDITARVEGQASSEFSAGVHGSVKFHSGVELSSRDQGHPHFVPPQLEDTDFHADTPEIVLRAGVKAGIGARLNVLLYSVAGPYLTARAYGAVDADPFADPCYKVRAGMEGDIGVKVTSPDLPVLGHVTLVDWGTTFTPIDIDVGSGSCKAPPNPPTLPPGSGPDATAFAKPGFKPWARLFSYPVDGATGTSPGGTSDWIDETRAIDGRLVLGGRSVHGLIKFDEEGAITWARSLQDSDDNPKIFLPYRTIATKDAGLMVLTTDGFQPMLIKMTQDGSALWRRTIDFGQSPCVFLPTGLATDGDAGYWLVAHGGCTNPEHTYVLHLGENADVLSTTELADATGAVRPTLAVAIDHDLVIGGVVSGEFDRMFMVRLGANADMKYANQYIGCDAASDNVPVTAVLESNGDLTVAGRGGAGRNAHVARIKPDGSVGFASFPGFGFGLGSIFVIDSLVELPTTGYIASGSTVRLTGDTPTNVPAMALVGLDSAGRVLWAKRYTLGDEAGGWISSSQSSLRLTDDGGVIVTAAAAGPNGLDGRLLSIKAFAKDGSLQFADGRGVVSALDTEGELKNLDCSLTASLWPVTVSNPTAPNTVDAPVIAVSTSFAGEVESAP